MKDTLNRRSRKKRQSSGRTLKIRPRDLQTLALLYRYRFLSSNDLADHLTPKSSKRLKERLGQLFHDGGLIDRPEEQWRDEAAHYAPNIYTLTNKGRALLKQEKRLPLQAVVYPKKSVGGERMQFRHSLKISQVVSQAELETKKRSHRRFVPIEEIKIRQLAKGKSFHLEFPVTIPISEENPHKVYRTTVKPDGLYGVEYTDSGKPLYRFFAVEVDISTPNKRSSLECSSILKKKLAYEAAINSGSYKEVLGVPNLNLVSL